MLGLCSLCEPMDTFQRDYVKSSDLLTAQILPLQLQAQHFKPREIQV